MEHFLLTTQTVQKETYEKEGNRTKTWEKLRKKWTQHYIKDIPSGLKKIRSQLLIAVRFTECFQVIYWIEWLAISGGYYLAIRELRSILEAVVQAFYIDHKYFHLNVEGKLAVLKEMLDIARNESHGKPLIQRAISPPLQEQVVKLYNDLSKFVHPSLDQIEAILSTENTDVRIIELMSPKYDQVLFGKCLNLSRKTISRIIDINKYFIKNLPTKYYKDNKV